MSTVEPKHVGILAPFHGFRTSRKRRVAAKVAAVSFILFCLIYGIAFGMFGGVWPRLFGIPIGVLAVLIVWALPEMKRYPDRTMSILAFVFLPALVVWPNYLAIALPGLPWITMTRLIGAPMAVAFLVCISVSKEFRSRLADINSAAPIMWILLLTFTATQVLTIGLSFKPFFSLQKVINTQMTCTAMFFVCSYALMKKGRPTLWATILCLTVIPITLIGIKEHMDSRLPWVGHIPSFLKIEDEAVLRTLAGGRREGGDYRLETTFTTPLGMGEYAALTMPFLLYFVTDAAKIWVRVLAAMGVPALFTLVVWADARLGLIGCMLGVLGFVLLRSVRHWRAAKESFWGPAIVLGYPAMAAAAVVASFVIHRIHLKVWGRGQYDASNQARLNMYTDGIPMILKAPWGHGAGTGAQTLGFFTPSGDITIDSYYLSIGLEFGVIGFIAYYGFIGVGAVISGLKVFKMPREKSEYDLFMPLTASLSMFLLIKSVFSEETNHPLVFAMGGMVVALCARMRNDARAAKAGIATNGSGASVAQVLSLSSQKKKRAFGR